MGGFGSGRRIEGGGGKTTDCSMLDILRLRRAGCLTSGWSGMWHWISSDEQKNSIKLRFQDDMAFLNYRTTYYGEKWHSISLAVQIVHQPCRYGGSRPYFLCPGSRNGRPCGKRVSKLYCAGIFRCRQCARLIYPSQSENQIDRALRRADKLRVRLGGSNLGLGAFVPRKPKGMWRRTYTRLQEEVLRLDDMADAAFAVRHLRAFGP